MFSPRVNNSSVLSAKPIPKKIEEMDPRELAAQKPEIRQIQERIDISMQEIGKYTAIVDNFTQLSEIITNFESLLENLHHSMNVNDNAFDYLKVNITSNDITGTNYIDMQVSPGAAIGTYSLRVANLATEKNWSATYNGTRNTPSTPSGILPGDIYITTKEKHIDGNAFNAELNKNQYKVTLAQDDTLENVASKINAISTVIGVRAVVININSSDQALQLISNSTGDKNNFEIYDINGNSAENLLAGNAVTPSPAVDASFTINNTAITRSSNTITDVIEGVTFNLLTQNSPGKFQRVAIEKDLDIVYRQIDSFVTTYNNLKTFLAINSEKDPYTYRYKETAILGGEPIINDINSQLENFVISPVKGISTSLKSLADIGITTFTQANSAVDNIPAVKNALKIDSIKLRNALTTKFDEVRKIFEFTLTAQVSGLKLGKHTKNINESNIKITIDTTAQIGQQAQVEYSSDGAVEFFEMSGLSGSRVLKGQKDSRLEGLTLTYTGSDTNIIFDPIILTQGIADKMRNFLGVYLQDVLTVGKIGERQATISKTMLQLIERNNRNKAMLEQKIQRVIQENAILLTKASASAQKTKILTNFLKEINK